MSKSNIESLNVELQKLGLEILRKQRVRKLTEWDKGAKWMLDAILELMEKYSL